MAVCDLCGKGMSFLGGMDYTVKHIHDEGEDKYSLCMDCFNKAKAAQNGYSEASTKLGEYIIDKIKDEEKKESFLKIIGYVSPEEIQAQIRAEEERQAQVRAEAQAKKKYAEDIRSRIIVTTGDLKRDYEVINPVYCQVNSKSNLSNFINKYSDLLRNKEEAGELSGDTMTGRELMEILFLNAGANNGHQNFDRAFYIAVEELKEKAALIGADAVIGMRQDIDLDSVGFQYFYLQMYGTAVKFI